MVRWVKDEDHGVVVAHGTVAPGGPVRIRLVLPGRWRVKQMKESVRSVQQDLERVVDDRLEVSATEFRRRLHALLGEVEYSGQRVKITRWGRVCAWLVPARGSLVGCWSKEEEEDGAT